MRKGIIIIASILVLTVFTISIQAQDKDKIHINPEDLPVDMDHPIMMPKLKIGKCLDTNGDTIPYIELPVIYIFKPLIFKNEKELMRYNRLVYNVKKVLPIAKEVNAIILETYDVLEQLPTKKAKDAHMKKVEEEIREEYSPRMKKLSYSQGKLLIKLINRECNSTSYELVKAFLGPVRAGFYQAFAYVFGASLRKQYDAENDDRLTERIVLLVESGSL